MIFLYRYILSVICTALVCGITSDLAAKTAFHKQLQFLCGVFLTVAMVQPLIRLDVDPSSFFSRESMQESNELIARGEEQTRFQIGSVIQEQCEAYILSEAKKQNADISVTVALDSSDPPKPLWVHLTGEMDSEKKTILQEIIEADIGVPKERQLWNETN